MVDYIQSKLEAFARIIPTIKHLKILTDEEIRQTTKKLKVFTENIASSNTIRDYKTCINWEKKLLKDLHKRQNKRQIRGKRYNWLIDLILIDYRRALSYHSLNYDLNVEYFNFLKYVDHNDKKNKSASSQLKLMIKRFFDKPDVFRLAANWYEDLGAKSDAKAMLFRGQALFPKSEIFYIDILKFELKTKKEVDPKTILTIEKVIDEMFKNKLAPAIFKKFIDIIEEGYNLPQVIDYAIEKLLNEYGTQLPDVWHLIALRELDGKSYTSVGDTSVSDPIERCNEVYRIGLSKLPNKARNVLWKWYLDTLSDVCLQSGQENILKQALEDFKDNYLEHDEKLFFLILKHLPEQENDMIIKLNEAIKHNKVSMPLWSTYVNYLLSKPDLDLAKKVLLDASKVLGVKVLQLYDLYFAYLKSNKPEIIVQQYEELLSASSYLHQDIIGELKVKYLSYIISKEGILAGYETYKKVITNPPFNKHLHETMFQAAREIEDLDQAAAISKKVIANWLNQFEMTDPKIYLNKIELALQEKKGNLNDEIRKIYDAAMVKLMPQGREEFKVQYDMNAKHYDEMIANSIDDYMSTDSDD